MFTIEKKMLVNNTEEKGIYFSKYLSKCRHYIIEKPKKFLKIIKTKLVKQILNKNFLNKSTIELLILKEDILNSDDV